MWDTVRGYLTFTRKERTGVLFLFLIIGILFVIPYFFHSAPGDPVPATYEKIKEGIRKFDSGSSDLSGKFLPSGHSPDHPQFAETIRPESSPRPFQGTMFYFDPNTLDEKEWELLGISRRLAQTILRYIEKGGQFRKAEDLKKLYGLHQPDYERLFPYVRIENQNKKENLFYKTKALSYFRSSAEIKDTSFREFRATTSPLNSRTYKQKDYENTDINLADSSAWSSFPGIGDKLASRIVHYRQKLGGFYQVDQVAETYGLPDSVFRKLKPYLRVNAVSLVRMDINSASKEILQGHPYIRWQIAKGIVDYRLQHGHFKSVDELLQLAQMDSLKFEKLKPYFLVEP